MVTRAKPRPLPDPTVGAGVKGQPTSGRESLFPTLFEILNIDRTGPSADSAKATIESVLEHCARGLLMHERVSQPAHTIAALEPIAEHAATLADLLDPFRLAQPVVRNLGVDRDEMFALRSSLEHIARTAHDAIERYRKLPSAKGEHNASYAAMLKDALYMFDRLFEHLRADQPDDDPAERDAAKQEFVRLCRGRMPAAPAHGGRPVRTVARKRAK